MQEHYLSLVAQGLLQVDAAQQQAVQALNYLAIELNTRKEKGTGWLALLFKPQPLKGVYLYGPVGRGKSMLMDMFFSHIATSHKLRLHFHHFMLQVHQDLAQLQGQKNPLKTIAKQWRSKTQVLCFDEFFVSDIGDAMILANLLDALFEQGVILVATSNCAPAELYKNGLQRQRFLRTIDLLERHCNPVSLFGLVDHRFAAGKLYRHFCVPNDIDWLKAQFKANSLCDSKAVNSSGTLLINHRQMSYLACYQQHIMFDFMALCSGPRSANDYIALAQQFKVLYVANVPVMAKHKNNHQLVQGVEDSYQRGGNLAELAQLDDEARRFIALVDECYDQQVLLVISSNADMQALYQGERLAFEFARTESRLVEMQTWLIS